MTKHERPANFGRPAQPAEPACRVSELAHRFGLAEREWNALDAKADCNKDAEITNDVVMHALRDAAAFEQAKSATGALFQLLIASADADLLLNHAGDDVRRVSLEHAIRLDYALWSVRRFIEGHFGVSAEGIGGEYLMPAHASYGGKLAVEVAAAETEMAAPTGPRLHVAN